MAFPAVERAVPPAEPARNIRTWLLVVYIPPYTGTIKKHDLSAVGTSSDYTPSQIRSLHLHRGYDFIIVNGEGSIDEAAAAYGYPREKILVHPIPKVELLKNKSYAKKMKERIFAAYPKLRQGKNILYCPTFRTNQKEHNAESKALFDALCAHEMAEFIVEYFEKNGSITAISEELFLHKNTVQYKIKKIKSKTRLDLRRAKDMIELYFAAIWYIEFFD